MTLDDTDFMPFGQYEGVRMEKVPAKYLHWLWTQDIANSPTWNRRAVADYIRRNLTALSQEYKDGIW